MNKPQLKLVRSKPTLPHSFFADDHDEVVVAEVVREYPVSQGIVLEEDLVRQNWSQHYQSWPFRFLNWASKVVNQLVGFMAMVVLVAIGANIPIVNLLSFGFLLDASGRVGRSGRLRDGFPGLAKASVFGRGVIGTWLCLLPVGLVQYFWYSAHLIDPESPQSKILRVVQIGLMIATALHLLAAWFCGGRLRHFLWPIVAPWSLGMWGLRKTLSTPILRPVVAFFCWPISRNLVDDIGRTQPIKDWFLPAVVIHQLFRRRLWFTARERLWAFVSEIPVARLFWLGLFGFLGTLVYLVIPTMLLVVSTAGTRPGYALIGLAGTMGATLIFSFLLQLQTQYAVDGNWRSFFRFGNLWGNLRRAPIWHWLSTVLVLILALPLFLAKIEEIPRELFWTLSLLFVALGWLGRVVLGWAYARGQKRERPRAWWWSIPVLLLIPPFAFSFVVIMFFTRYLSWNGALSMIENPVFLLPTPFWLM